MQPRAFAEHLGARAVLSEAATDDIGVPSISPFVLLMATTGHQHSVPRGDADAQHLIETSPEPDA